MKTNKHSVRKFGVPEAMEVVKSAKFAATISLLLVILPVQAQPTNANGSEATVEQRKAQTKPFDSAAHERLGDTHRVRDEIDAAVSEYQTAINLNDTAQLQVKLGQCFQAKHDLAHARTAFLNANRLKADDSDILDALLAGWQAITKEQPQDPINHIGLGQAFEMKGSHAEAELEYKQAILQSPDKTNAQAKMLLERLKLRQR